MPVHVQVQVQVHIVCVIVQQCYPIHLLQPLDVLVLVILKWESAKKS